jgi:hypothetical protein
VMVVGQGLRQWQSCGDCVKQKQFTKQRRGKKPRTESRQNCEPKGAIGNRLGGGAEPDIGDHRNPTVNILPQTEDVSYSISLV